MSDMADPDRLGVLLPNGCRVTHGAAGDVKTPFDFSPVTLHELSAGGDGRAFCGQFGIIPFRADFRLPRHVHIDRREKREPQLVAERILVVNGVGLTELAGGIHVVAPGSLVEIRPGVPHTWTACPAGVALPDGTVSDGQFLMIYEYSEPTSFYPTKSTEAITSVADYQPYDGDLQAIRFPELTAEQVTEQASLVWDHDVRTDLCLAV